MAHKYKRIQVNAIIAEPKIYSIVFLIEGVKYLRTRVAYDLDSACKDWYINGKTYRDLSCNMSQWTSMSISDIRIGFKNVRP